jgi:hypothetical protein
MGTMVGVGVPSNLFMELADFLREKKDPRDPPGVVQECIRYWLDNASWKSELLAPSETLGFQWKEIFLPAGTQLRMPYKGKYFYAKVEGDLLMFDGQSSRRELWSTRLRKAAAMHGEIYG